MESQHTVCAIAETDKCPRCGVPILIDVLNPYRNDKGELHGVCPNCEAVLALTVVVVGE